MKNGKLFLAVGAVSLLAFAVPMDSHATDKPPTGVISVRNGICDSDGDSSKFCQSNDEYECSTTPGGYEANQCCENWDTNPTCHLTTATAQKILCRCTSIHTGVMTEYYFYVRYATSTLPQECVEGCVHH